VNPSALEIQLIGILSRSPEVGSPGSEARLILFHLLQRPGSPLNRLSDVTSAFEALAAEARTHLAREAVALAESRTRGALLQHLLGFQFFLNHDYSVSPAVLIPRPETEVLATHAIEWAKRASTHQGTLRFAELGLGSGILSCELLSALPGAVGVASELAPDAIRIAETNLARIVGPSFHERLQILHAPGPDSGFEIFIPHSPFDLILSNPPYVSPDDEIEAQVLREEPRRALFAEGGVNRFYESFAIHGRSLLRSGGRAFFEIPHERAPLLLTLFEGAGFRVDVLPDLTGRPRVMVLE
jgi:release factor glutamine methyltransferase